MPEFLLEKDWTKVGRERKSTIAQKWMGTTHRQQYFEGHATGNSWQKENQKTFALGFLS